jgi:hypothetical protein
MADFPEETVLPTSAAFSDEPFACPHCGQMLAPSVRTCPSCKSAIDPKDIVRPAEAELVVPVVEPVIAPPPAPEYARFSWGIFFVTLGIWLVAGLFTESVLGAEKGQFVLGAVVVLSSLWVFRDARQRNIPKPIRWGLGSFLLWIVIFPWYLARRRVPNAECPFIEGESGKVVRTLLFFLLIFFLLSLLMLLIKGPQKPSTKAPDTHGISAPSGKIAVLTGSFSAQPATRAPSEASQT